MMENSNINMTAVKNSNEVKFSDFTKEAKINRINEAFEAEGMKIEGGDIKRIGVKDYQGGLSQEVTVTTERYQYRMFWSCEKAKFSGVITKNTRKVGLKTYITKIAYK